MLSEEYVVCFVNFVPSDLSTSVVHLCQINASISVLFARHFLREFQTNFGK